jgi:cobalt-zinc-cadmium efflux system protein
VARVDDLHVWAMSTTQVALTAHLVMPEGAPGDDFLRETAEEYAFLIDTLGAPYEPHD